MKGEGELRNRKVKLMWVGGWYERIAVTVRLRLRCFHLSLNLFRSRLSRPCQGEHQRDEKHAEVRRLGESSRPPSNWMYKIRGARTVFSSPDGKDLKSSDGPDSDIELLKSFIVRTNQTKICIPNDIKNKEVVHFIRREV